MSIEHLGIDLKHNDINKFLGKVLREYSFLDKDIKEIIDRYELTGTPFIESGVESKKIVDEKKTKLIHDLVDNIQKKIGK